MPKYNYSLVNGKTLTLEGDTQPSDEEVESIAKEQKVELQSADTQQELIKPQEVAKEIIPTKKKGFKGPWWNPIEIPEGEAPERIDRAMFGIKPKQAETWWRGFANSVLEQTGEILGPPEVMLGGFGTTLLRSRLPSIAKQIESRDLSNLAAVEKWAKGKQPKLLVKEDIAIGSPTVYHGTRDVFDTFSTKQNKPYGLFPNMTRFTENPEYSQLYSLGETPSGMKRYIEGYVNRPNTIAAKIGAKNILDLTKPIPSHQLAELQKTFPELIGNPSNEFIQDILSRTKNPIPFDSIRYLEHGQINWAVPEGVSIKTPQGVPLTKPHYTAAEIAANFKQYGQAFPPASERIESQVPLNWKTDPQKAINMKRAMQERIAKGKIPTAKLQGEPPIPPKIQQQIEKEPGKLQQWYDVTRGLMSVDPPFMTSAAFRQAGKYAGTKEWFKAWAKSAQAFGSKATADLQETLRLQKPLFKPTLDPITNKMTGPSYAEQVGLRRGSLGRYSRRDEAIRGQLAERIPIYGRYIAGSNRAYNAFINHVSDTKLESMVDTAVKLNKAGKLGGITGNLFSKDVTPNPLTDLTAGKKIADFINTSLGRGRLGVEVGKHEVNLENSARLLSNTFFSPRMISSHTRMLNPSTYIMAPPQIRREYLAAMIRQVSLWWSMGQLAEFGGAQVSKDATSADFGKIKIGNMRIDPPGGLQQYLVLGARDLPESMGGGGITSTTTGKFTPFGEGFKPETRAAQALQFGVNRLHPTIKIAWDLANVQKSAPFHVTDRALQAVLPMYADDLANIAKYNPDIASFILGGLAAGSGMGTQAYERGSYGKPVFWPEELDINIGR